MSITRIPNIAYWAIIPAIDEDKFYMSWHDARKRQIELGMGYIKSRMQISQPVFDSDGEDYMILIKLIPKDIPSEENVEYSVGYMYIGKTIVALHLKNMIMGGMVTAPQTSSKVKYWEAMTDEELKTIVTDIIKYFKEKDLEPKWNNVDFSLADVALNQQVTDDIWDTGDFRDVRKFKEELAIPVRRKFKKNKIYDVEVVAKEQVSNGGRWLLKVHERGSGKNLYWVAYDSNGLVDLVDTVVKKFYGLGYKEI